MIKLLVDPVDAILLMLLGPSVLSTDRSNLIATSVFIWRLAAGGRGGLTLVRLGSLRNLDRATCHDP